MRRAVVAILGTLALTAAAVAVDAAAGRTAGRTHSAARGQGFFRSRCEYSHTAPDDPILMPNMPGMSMVHDFFGNASTSASSTGAELRADARTSCLAPADTSAYWVPALYQHGTRVVPKRMVVYYRRAGRRGATIEAPPPGLQMIAGNEVATAPQSTDVAYWNCGARASVAKSALPPAACPAGSQLVLSLVFPDCWDGHTLAGAGQHNVTYAVGGACPVGHAVAIPRLVVHVHYPIASGEGLTLSMGPTANTMPGSIYTAHADFFNAWDPSVLERLVRRCDDVGIRCGTVGPANRALGLTPAERRRLRARRAGSR